MAFWPEQEPAPYQNTRYGYVALVLLDHLKSVWLDGGNTLFDDSIKSLKDSVALTLWQWLQALQPHKRFVHDSVFNSILIDITSYKHVHKHVVDVIKQSRTALAAFRHLEIYFFLYHCTDKSMEGMLNAAVQAARWSLVVNFVGNNAELAMLFFVLYRKHWQFYDCVLDDCVSESNMKETLLAHPVYQAHVIAIQDFNSRIRSGDDRVPLDLLDLDLLEGPWQRMATMPNKLTGALFNVLHAHRIFPDFPYTKPLEQVAAQQYTHGSVTVDDVEHYLALRSRPVDRASAATSLYELRLEWLRSHCVQDLM